jgi:negative regulator of replication initiation
MKITIEIDLAVFQALEIRAVGFGLTPNDIIKQLLAPVVPPSKATGACSCVELPNSVPNHPIQALLVSAEYVRADYKERYFHILRFLYESDSKKFGSFDGYQQGTRIQISTSKQAIERSGRSTWPEELTGTPYWALTNLDNKKKRRILDVIMRVFEFPENIIAAVLATIPDRSHRDFYK